MAITRKAKEEALKSFSQDLESAKGVVFTQYSGMTVKEIDKLRKDLRKENVKFQVIKVTLLKKALEKLGIDISKLKYNGPLAVALSAEEETTPARLLKKLSKENTKIVLGGGVFNKDLVDVAVVNQLASLPSKHKLLAQLASVIAGPARGLVMVLSGN